MPRDLDELGVLDDKLLRDAIHGKRFLYVASVDSTLVLRSISHGVAASSHSV